MVTRQGLRWSGLAVDWTDGDLVGNLREFSPKVELALAAIMQYEAPNVEGHARSTALWTDRTGNARGSLTARAFARGHTHGIRLSHGVPYGIWLEVRFAGRYAVIDPTIQHMGPKVMETCTLLFGRL